MQLSPNQPGADFELYPIPGSSRDRHWVQAFGQRFRRYRRYRVSSASRLRNVPGSEGMARTELARVANQRAKRRDGNPHTRTFGSLRLDPEIGEGRISRTSLRDTSNR